MATFRFRMATLLKLREATRDERRRHLAQALEALQILQNRIADLQRDQHELLEICRNQGQGGAVDVDRLLQWNRYQWQLKHDEQVAAEQMRKVSDEVEKRRLALMEADRQVKALDKLRERQLERHRHEEDRREGIRLDEVATQGVAWREVNQ